MERDIRITLAENIDRFWNRKTALYTEMIKILGSKEEVSNMLEGKAVVDIVAVQRISELLEVNIVSMFEDWSVDECQS